MSQSTFVAIATAIDEVGGKPHDLLEALKEGLVQARGRLISEGDDHAAEYAAIPVTYWLDYVFDPHGFYLSGVATDASGASTQLAYIHIQIKRADLEKLVPKKKIPAKKEKAAAKPGQKQHPGKTPIMAELARWEQAAQPPYKNRAELTSELIKWYEKAHGATGPDPSKVLEWLRKDRKDNRWHILIRFK